MSLPRRQKVLALLQRAIHLNPGGARPVALGLLPEQPVAGEHTGTGIHRHLPLLAGQVQAGPPPEAIRYLAQLLDEDRTDWFAASNSSGSSAADPVNVRIPTAGYLLFAEWLAVREGTWKQIRFSTEAGTT